MSMINQKILGILFGIFLLILTLIHSQLFTLFGINNFLVNGNYEFTKVMIFNIIFPLFFGIVLIFGLLGKYKVNFSKNIILSILFFYIILIISTYLSAIPFQSLFGGVDKSHGFIFWNNLILFFMSIYVLLQNISEKYILNSIVLSAVFLSLYGIYEYFLPSFEYGDLGNRLISSFGHPNYIASVLLLLIPYIVYNLSIIKYKYSSSRLLNIMILGLFLFTLLLTKSALAIVLIVIYFIFKLFKKYNFNNYLIYYLLFLIGIIISGLILLFYFIPEKISSFISRFYIWETTLKIIFSDIKIFFFGIGSDNLGLYFDNFKSPELYLYENIGFNADRPHNIFLNFFVHFGIFGLVFISGIFYKIIKDFNSNNWWNYSLLLSLLFWNFNFPNIIGYLFFIIIFSYSLIKKYNNSGKTLGKIKYNNIKINNLFYNYITKLFILILLSISIIGSIYSYKSYIAETLVKQNKYSEALEYFPYYSDYYYNNYKLKEGLKIENYFYSEEYYLYNIYFSFEKIESCKNLVKNYPSVENYFYCGQLIENKFSFSEAQGFYKQGILKFPDIWNKNSKSLQSFTGKYIMNTSRVLHSKYSNIKYILEKLNISNNIF